MRFAVSLVLVLAACGGGGGSSAAALPPPNLAGSWIGTARSASTNEQMQVAFALQPEPSGGYSVTGTVTPSACFSSFSGLVTTAGLQVRLISGGGYLSFAGAVDQAGTTISGSYAVVSSSPCGEDDGILSLSRQPAGAFLYVEQIDLPDLTIRLEVLGTLDDLR